MIIFSFLKVLIGYFKKAILIISYSLLMVLILFYVSILIKHTFCFLIILRILCSTLVFCNERFSGFLSSLPCCKKKHYSPVFRSYTEVKGKMNLRVIFIRVKHFYCKCVCLVILWSNTVGTLSVLSWFTGQLVSQ